MGSFSLVHWIIVLVVILLLFGPRRLPDLAKGVGEAIREFKKAVNSPDQKQLPSNQNTASHQIQQRQGDGQAQDPVRKDPPTS